MASRTASSRRASFAGRCGIAALAVAGTLAAAGRAAPARAVTVCLVTAAPGASGAALDGSVRAGLARAVRGGVRGLVFRPARISSYAANLRACVRRKATLTIGVGVGMVSALDAVAEASPRSSFALVGGSVASLPHRPPNVVGLVFAEQQAGYLVGYAAGLWTKLHGGRAVGSIGTLKIPPVDRFIAGFQFGAKRADPGVKTLNDYADRRVGTARCRTLALEQISDGSGVEFQVAGGCGAGVLEAAQSRGVFAIGSVADQAAAGPWVMTSAVEHGDVAVAAAVAAVRRGRVRTGVDRVFDVRDGGVGCGAWSARVPQAIRTAVARQLERLRHGRLPAIPTVPG